MEDVLVRDDVIVFSGIHSGKMQCASYAVENVAICWNIRVWSSTLTSKIVYVTICLLRTISRKKFFHDFISMSTQQIDANKVVGIKVDTLELTLGLAVNPGSLSTLEKGPVQIDVEQILQEALRKIRERLSQRD